MKEILVEKEVAEEKSERMNEVEEVDKRRLGTRWGEY